ncbi:DUF461 domain-containing protein [Streptomyces sp. NPDC002671]
MSSSLRRGALAASAIVFSIASLAACGAGSDSQTLEIKPDNAAVSIGNIKIQNALVITQPDLKSTGPAVISATIFNSGKDPETLQSISVGSTSAELKAAKGQSLSIPAHGSLIIGGQGNASAVLASGREAVQDGNVQKVTFTLSTSGAVNLQAFVVPATSYFSKWGPSNIPSAPASASATATASATGAPGATASASGKPAKNGKNSPSATASDKAGTGAVPSGSASQSAAGH